MAALRSDVDRMLASAKTLRGTHVGLLAVDTQSGNVLYARKPDDAFMPASTLKVVTGSVALATLGPDFTFKTQVATIPDGDAAKLVLIGGGDPLLGADDLEAAAAAVAAANVGPISEIDADTSLFDQEPYGYGWTIDDIPEAYAAPISALCFEDNVMERTPLPDPTMFALKLFESALRANGVDVQDDVPTAIVTDPPATPYTMLWTHPSQPLSWYLARMWYPSDNLIAETLIKTLGVARHGPPGTAENGAKLETDWLHSIGINTKRNTAISDGSGVSIYDRLSPRTLVKIFQVDWKGQYRDIVLAALPEAGVRGTLQHSFLGTPAERHTFAKDGNRLFASSLAGYLMSRKHGTITFAFMVDDWMGDDRDLERLEARLLSRFITG
jgi:D-alanyl-D-alanine carboxypeptidase/D-alanyl-D-alanine-endopeptidase (penicillin-binding protein 4)